VKRRGFDALHGAVIIDKPEGPTSFAAMRQAARALGVRRSGHTGTLDPAASGVIVVLLGEATKLAGVLVHDDKVYEAEVRLGVGTDTLDREGRVVAEAEVGPEQAAPEEIARFCEGLRGEIMQVPPIWSALKRQGRTLMSRARAGEEVEVEARPVTCHSVALLEMAPGPRPTVRLRVHCGKGFYVRSLARDLGLFLGVPAHLGALRRTRVGGFDMARARAPEAVTTEDVLSIPELLATWRHVEAAGPEAIDLHHGRPVARDALPVRREPLDADDERALALDSTGRPLALLRGDGALWRVERGFVIDIAERSD
jgi:tRNA pseudouridine55 synthase